MESKLISYEQEYLTNDEAEKIIEAGTLEMDEKGVLFVQFDGKKYYDNLLVNIFMFKKIKQEEKSRTR